MRQHCVRDVFLGGMVQPLVVVVLALLVGACQPTPSEPVGSLVAEPSELKLAHGTAVDVVLRFEPTAELGGEEGAFVFVHLLDDQGAVVLTADHALGSAWSPGERIDDPVRLFHSALGPALPAGDYGLTAGLFRGDARWSLEAGDEVARQEYRIARVTVPETSLPMPEFSPTWMPVSLGADRQVVARRWLAENGSITVEVPEEGGSLALEIQIPEATTVQQLVLEEGETVPRVKVLARCTGQRIVFEGAGRHGSTLALERPAAAVAEGDAITETGEGAGDGAGDEAADGAGEGTEAGETACTLVFEANYQLVDTQTFAKALLTLEQLAWVTR